HAGSGSWESTRNLRLSARDGFLPWVIVGAAAPRGLIYAHEFAWDPARDPVWKRLEKIYEWYGARDRLASVAGKGAVTGKPPESTHCNHIGPVHRRQIYPALKRWFGIPEPDREYQKRRPAEDLICLTPEATAALRPRPVYQLAAQLGEERAAAARQPLSKLRPIERTTLLRLEWARRLGTVEGLRGSRSEALQGGKVGEIVVERLALAYPEGKGPSLTVKAMLLIPPHGK